METKADNLGELTIAIVSNYKKFNLVQLEKFDDGSYYLRFEKKNDRGDDSYTPDDPYNINKI